MGFTDTQKSCLLGSSPRRSIGIHAPWGQGLDPALVSATSSGARTVCGTQPEIKNYLSMDRTDLQSNLQGQRVSMLGV